MPATGRAQTDTNATPTTASGGGSGSVRSGGPGGPGGPQSWVYTVRAGDTLPGICRAYVRAPDGCAKVTRVNRLDPNHLRVGTQVRIPLAMLRTFEGTADAMWTRGEVRAFAANGAPVAVTAGVRLLTGSRIETGPQAAVLLRLLNGALLLVDERSQVVLDEMTVYALTGTMRTHIRMDGGRIENQVVSPFNGPSQYQIKTPVVTTAARGTEFRVAFDDQQRTARTEVVKGRIQVDAASHHLPLDAGFGLITRADGSNAPPVALPATPDLATLPTRLDRLPVQLTWPAVAAAARYRVRLLDAAGRALFDDVVSTPKAQWPEVPDGAYRVSVRAIDDAGLEGRDGEAAVAIHTKPEPPLVTAPRHASQIYGTEVEFEWTRSDGATHYDLDIADEPTFAHPIATITASQATRYRRELQPGRYYWRIASRASTADRDRGPFGDPVSFMLRRYPDGREAQGEIGQRLLSLRWTAGRPGETAQFELSRDRTFATHLFEQTTTALQVDVPRPEAGTYFVRVRSIDDQGTAGPYGPIQTIEVPPPRHRRWWPWLLVPAAVIGAVVGLR